MKSSQECNESADDEANRVAMPGVGEHHHDRNIQRDVEEYEQQRIGGVPKNSPARDDADRKPRDREKREPNTDDDEIREERHGCGAGIVTRESSSLAVSAARTTT